MQAIVDVLRDNAMHLLSVRVASSERDLKKATDLVISVDGGDVAVRIRRAKYKGRYRDLTIRAWREGGIRTELEKLVDGFGDWYLYAWSNGHGGLDDWFLVDLNKLRISGLLSTQHIRYNKDGQTGFISISDRELRTCGCMISEKNTGAESVQAAF